MMNTTLHWLSRPLIFALALMLIIGAGLPTPTRAQSDAETVWYWATTPEGWVAYTLDGRMNLLLADSTLIEGSFGGSRLTNQTALLGGQDEYYYATSETIKAFPHTSVFEYMTASEYRYPFLLRWATETPEIGGAVLNVETGETQELRDTLMIYPSPRFLPDGHTLRYVSFERPVNPSVYNTTLWERDLVTGEEKALLRFENTGQPFVVTDLNGENWWVALDLDTELQQFGRVETYGDNINPDFTDLVRQASGMTIDDSYFSYDRNCVANCEINVYPLGRIGIDSFTYQLPPSVSGPGSIHLFPDDSLLYYGWRGGSSGPIWLLETNGNNIQLGWFDPYVMGRLEYSEDGRWAAALEPLENGGYQYVLWYLPRREKVFAAQLERPQAAFQGDTVLIYEQNHEYAVYWRGANQAVDLRNFPSNAFYIVGDEGKLLYEALEGGIYLFDPKTYTSTLLVPNGHACCDFYRTY